MASSTQAMVRLAAPNIFTTPTAHLTRGSPLDAIELAAANAFADPAKAGRYSSLMALHDRRRPAEQEMLADYARQVQLDRTNAQGLQQWLMQQQGVQVQADATRALAAATGDLSKATHPGILKSVQPLLDIAQANQAGQLNQATQVAEGVQKLGSGMHQGAEGGLNLTDPTNAALVRMALPQGKGMMPLGLAQADISNNKDSAEEILNSEGKGVGFKTTAKGKGAGQRVVGLSQDIRTAKEATGIDDPGLRGAGAGVGAAVALKENLAKKGWQHVGSVTGNDGSATVRMRAPSGEVHWKRFEADGRPGPKGIE